ncbi:chaplin [Streptomyces fradiae]|uniref:chaplin n=1 Tax=Streptomyces fradiae TaxID=1906 RepID=UPI003404565A
MRHSRRNGLVILMATSGALALAAGSAQADAGASGAAVGSPGVISGNTVQLPVHVPVNVCGNTVNVVGLLNPAFGNACANKGGDAQGSHKDKPGTPHGSGQGGSGHGAGGSGSGNGGGGATADGAAVGSPGVISGNGVQLPVDLPANVSGNSVDVVGIGNPVFGNSSVNGGGTPPTVTTPPKPAEPTTPPKSEEPAEPAEPAAPKPAEEAPAPAPAHAPSLAVTGSGDLVGIGLPAAALVLAGALLYRRSRPSAARA